VREVLHHVNHSAVFHEADANAVKCAVQHVGQVKGRAHEGFVRTLDSRIVNDVFSRLVEPKPGSQSAG